MQDSLATFQQWYLQIKVLQYLNQRRLQSRYLQTVLNTTYEADRIDVSPNILKQATDKCCKRLWSRKRNGESNPRGLVSEYFSRSSHRSSSFWSLAKSIAYGDRCEGMECDGLRRHTLLTSPRRSIIRCSAFLLSPIRPSRNTISGTRSRSVQILYA